MEPEIELLTLLSKESKKLNQWVLSNTGISSFLAGNLLQAIFSNTALKDLKIDLSYNNFLEGDIRSLVAAISMRNNLHHLTLGHTKMREEAYLRFLQALSSSGTFNY